MDNRFMPEARYILPSFEERTSYGFKRQDPYAKLLKTALSSSACRSTTRQPMT